MTALLHSYFVLLALVLINFIGVQCRTECNDVSERGEIFDLLFWRAAGMR
jgi:hypothetical protein